MDWTLLTSIIAAVAATVGTVYAYLNHHDRVGSEPPYIDAPCPTPYKTRIFCISRSCLARGNHPCVALRSEVGRP